MGCGGKLDPPKPRGYYCTSIYTLSPQYTVTGHTMLAILVCAFDLSHTNLQLKCFHRTGK